jgi:hypothetical protein
MLFPSVSQPVLAVTVLATVKAVTLLLDLYSQSSRLGTSHQLWWLLALLSQVLAGPHSARLVRQHVLDDHPLQKRRGYIERVAYRFECMQRQLRTRGAL